ncbi:DUF2911 domain-containing protein [Lacinutrix sp. WUR7]|uniref:DUF2911 domain-containing protein n=1 Tax=Lacinutrix sp. WUR7 TaxID=2653681 RepID=UPI00193EBF8F|nr:DUF2911 domain-containing protein [Lacinutrix sp. WUR7]QRM87818.1 DUF2911 domain-containing protein [Lacinutrix sp. WUR7]
MKINILYYALFALCISSFASAQEQLIKTTTIQKIGATELKVSTQQPTKLQWHSEKNIEKYKQQWKQNVNGKTEIAFNKDVIINNINIKAGKYLLLIFPGNDWKPANDSLYVFPGNDWKPKDTIANFPGNDWQPTNDVINVFPGNDWNPKNSLVKFPGNDWKPKKSKLRFPGNDWKPVNTLMSSFPGNDWLVVFYKNTGSTSKKLDKSLIVGEVTVASKKRLTPAINLSANFIYLNTNSVQLEISWKKTMLSIPINMK